MTTAAPIQTPAPTPTATPKPTRAPKATPTICPVTPEPTEEPTVEPTATPSPFSKTVVIIDERPSIVLASRQAAESLLSSVYYYFETLDIIPPGSVTTLVSNVELEDADPESSTVDYDEAFDYFTSRGTPLKFLSEVTFFQDNVLEHKDVIEYTDTLPAGYRQVVCYGMDGISRIIYYSTYINGERKEITEQERAVVYPAVNGRVLVGTGVLGYSTPPIMSFGNMAPLPEGMVIDVPVSGTVIKFFGMYPFEFHQGIDIACAAGTEVTASCAGIVAAVMERGSYGLMVEIDHGDGVSTRYAKLGSASVEIGQRVEAGQVIGTVAESRSNAHLHFELHCGTTPYNPLLVFESLDKLDLTYAVAG